MKLAPLLVCLGFTWLSACSTPPTNLLDVRTSATSRAVASVAEARQANVGTNAPDLDVKLPEAVRPNGDLPSAPTMPALEVKQEKPIRYIIWGILAADHPDYGTFVLRDERSSATAGNVCWAEPGHWNEQIVAVEGQDITALKLREARSLMRSADPVHFTMRARSGRLTTIECYSRPRDGGGAMLPVPTQRGPVRGAP